MMPPVWMNLQSCLYLEKRGLASGRSRLLSGCVLHLEDGIYLDHDQHLDGSGRVRSKSCLLPDDPCFDLGKSSI